MPQFPLSSETRPVWFVGASYGANQDQTGRFIDAGIWEVHSPSPKERALVLSMKPGDRIAIKAAFVRKHDLPFANGKRPVSALRLKAVGTVRHNPNDGERVEVEWQPTPPRDWYFYTFRGTIWQVVPGENWQSDGLIAFAFDGAPQDTARFLAQPKWRERFGDDTPQHRFGWTTFYEAVADKLLGYRHNRPALLEGLRSIASRVPEVRYLGGDKYGDGTTGFLRDICPFTTMGIFNRNTTLTNRRRIAGEIAAFLEVAEPVPESFEAIPLLNNMNSWYFPIEAERSSDHVDALWDVFEAALAYADGDEESNRERFAAAFDNATGRPYVGWNLTFGLYWARPWSFLSLEETSRIYIRDKLGVAIGLHGPSRRSSASDYLDVMDRLESSFVNAPSYPVHDYPELSLQAYLSRAPQRTEAPTSSPTGSDDADPTDEAVQVVTRAPYTIDDIVREGCFLPREELRAMQQRLLDKKNLILQGPPGTGKTWLAKRLGFALIGQKDDNRLRAVQFHPNLSYEDFVRGWRPGSDGRLAITDGVFLEAVKAALQAPSEYHVVVIEEINRGNPAQVFGELLTLLEASKRTPQEALELCYPDETGQRRVYIPENLYVIGTMNIADRSLALVDMAFRRRFAFIDLQPCMGQAWHTWVTKECRVDGQLATDIERRLGELNRQIAGDSRLGKQFCIGQSFVTPMQPLEAGTTRDWFRQVIDTEIGPLLEEYWYDDHAAAQKARERLIQGW